MLGRLFTLHCYFCQDVGNNPIFVKVIYGFDTQNDTFDNGPLLHSTCNLASLKCSDILDQVVFWPYLRNVTNRQYEC